MGLRDDYTEGFLTETAELIRRLDRDDIEAVAEVLVRTKNSGGRLFFAGSGGGAGHASHATADFRKIGGFEAYCVSDNVSELTARVNDDSWEYAYADWLRASRIGPQDCLFIFSVGGGDASRAISPNLVQAMNLARGVGASVVGVAGRDGGHLRQIGDASVLVPVGRPEHVTTQVEGFQALLWHLLVGHPLIEGATPKWESIDQ